jgi:recombination protein RecA
MNEEDIKKSLRRRPRSPIRPVDLLSTGSTLLNLACSGRRSGGIPKGTYANFCGDSTSGKTWLAKSCLAEASINSEFDDYRFIFDNAENGSLMDDSHFFGPKMAARVEPPATDRGRAVYSTTVEEFYFHVDDALQDGRPFIYVLDSMDALDADADKRHFSKLKKAHRGDREVEGSYYTAKAKINSQIRLVGNELARTGSILIVISQAKDKIGSFVPGQKTIAGGKAVKFYAHLQIWSSVRRHLKKKFHDKDRELGIVATFRVEKNRVTGRQRSVEVPIYHSYGMDNTESCINFLIDEKHWKMRKGIVHATELDVILLASKLPVYVEAEGKERVLQRAVQKVWNEIEDALTVKRHPRYE